MASATLSTTHAQRMRLFRERAEHVAALLHDALSRLHLFFKGRVVRTAAVAIGRFGQEYNVTLLDLVSRRSFLRQHKANRVADLYQFKGDHLALHGNNVCYYIAKWRVKEVRISLHTCGNPCQFVLSL